MRRWRAASAVLPAVFLVSCGQTPPPELTVYADGESLQVEPLRYCNVTVSKCDAPTKSPASLSIRPGKPLQISLPSEVSETPWRIIVISVDAEGNPLKPEEKIFTPRTSQPAFTAEPPAPDARLAGVEVQQVSGAMVLQQGNSDPDFAARGVWSIKFQPA